MRAGGLARLAFTVALALIPSQAFAQTTLNCTSTSWAYPFKVETTTRTCNLAAAGEICNTGTRLAYCNSTTWTPTETVCPTCTPSTVGYFVLTNSTWNGNLGGLSGANDKCRAELTARSWLNKPATLDQSKIFAFLCDSTTCQNPLGNTLYQFADAIDTASTGGVQAGGAAFYTGATGQGPYDTTAWSFSDYQRFYYGGAYWTGRAEGSNTRWPLTPFGAGQCQNWTSSSSSLAGRIGAGNSTANQWRWSQSNNQCDQLQNLICFVNP